MFLGFRAGTPLVNRVQCSKVILKAAESISHFGFMIALQLANMPEG